jgi:hypothetical protein
VKVPDLIEKRIVKQFHLKSIGTGRRNDYVCAQPGKDMVLEMRYKGRNIKPGDKVLKSKIDLVLGDGKMSYEEEIGTDSIANPTEEMPNEQ